MLRYLSKDARCRVLRVLPLGAFRCMGGRDVPNGNRIPKVTERYLMLPSVPIHAVEFEILIEGLE